jgi:hypothetical protein
MYERVPRPGSISPLQLFALVTIASAIFLNTAPYIRLVTIAEHEAEERNRARAGSTA